jgi:hypothetical protein
MEVITLDKHYKIKVSELVRSGKINASIVDAENRPICGRTFFRDVTTEDILEWAKSKLNIK